MKQILWKRHKQFYDHTRKSPAALKLAQYTRTNRILRSSHKKWCWSRDIKKLLTISRVFLEWSKTYTLTSNHLLISPNPMDKPKFFIHNPIAIWIKDPINLTDSLMEPVKCEKKIRNVSKMQKRLMQINNLFHKTKKFNHLNHWICMIHDCKINENNFS